MTFVEVRIFWWRSGNRLFSPSFYLSSTILIRAGDKLLEATSETLATPRYFRGATMIQRQLRPRKEKEVEKEEDQL